MSTELIESYQLTKQNLDALFNPTIRVVPEKDWSKIKAIWIPFLHHDANNQLENSEKITLLQKTTDKFGTVQAYLTAPNENYIPYLTTFFNPAWTAEMVIEKIMQAHHNILAIEQTVTDALGEKIIRTTSIGVAKSGMLIAITTNAEHKIIDAFPVFYTSSSQESIKKNNILDDVAHETQQNPTNEQIITITYNPIIKSYVATQPMSYDVYLLYLLLTQDNDKNKTSAKSWIQFCKTSSIKCLALAQLFINKNNGYIELYSMHDLTANTDDLCLPKSPKYIMTTKNFMNFMVQRSQIFQHRAEQFFMIIDAQGHAHLTTNLQSLQKMSFFGALQKRLAKFFTR